MPFLTSLIAIATVATSLFGVMQASAAAKKQEAAAAEQAKLAKAALQAKRPSEDTEAKVKLAKRDRELKRGKGSLAQREREKKQNLQAGGLAGQSASEVGGL